MFAATRQRLPLALLLTLAAAAITLLILADQIGAYAHLFWIAVAGAIALLVWVLHGNFAHAVLLWIILTAFFPAHFWHLELPGFFDVTIGRISIVVLGVLFLLRSFISGLPRLPTLIIVLMATVAGYFAYSASQAGWTISVWAAPPYYRLFVGYIFPFAAFVFTLAAFPPARLNSHHPESIQYYQRFLRHVLWLFFAFGIYLTFTAICERFSLWSLVWPRFIADPNIGLNFGRARGPFGEAFAMALTLNFLFFVSLFLARHTVGPMRFLFRLSTIPILLGVYFTYTRTGYICLLVSGVVWIWLVSGRLRRSAALAIITAVLITAVVANWATVSSQNRTAGGLAEIRPILSRVAVSKLALDLTAERPLFGVGFGHYRQAIWDREKDLASSEIIYAHGLSQSVAVLSVLCETGLIGLALYIALFISLLLPSLRLYHRLPLDGGVICRDFIVLFWILYIQTALMSITADPSYYPYTTGLLMFFAALTVGLEFHFPAMDRRDRSQTNHSAPESSPVQSIAPAPIPAGLNATVNDSPSA